MTSHELAKQLSDALTIAIQIDGRKQGLNQRSRKYKQLRDESVAAWNKVAKLRKELQSTLDQN